MKRHQPHTRPANPRLRLLNSPVQIMPLPEGAGDRLAMMGFRTVREAFRAALAGRLASRKKGGARLEDAVLTSGCNLLGYTPLTRKKIRNFRPYRPGCTVGEALESFCGVRPPLTESQRQTSIRDILLPLVMHNSLQACGVETLGQVLVTDTGRLQETEGMGGANLGVFLSQLFDFLFILSDPAADAVPAVSDRAETAPNTLHRLDTWLDDHLLTAGRELLAAAPPENLLLYRQTAGALFREAGRPVSVYLCWHRAPGSEGQPDWRLVRAGCETCFPAARYQAGCCRHVAALTLFLTEHRAGAGSELPLPVQYAGSLWHLIANLLHELYGTDQRLAALPLAGGRQWLLKVPGGGAAPLAEWRLAGEELAVARALFPGQIELPAGDTTPPAAAAELPALWHQLLELGRAPGEMELPGRGRPSPDQQADRSLWRWLGALLFQELPAETLSLTGPDREGLFSLIAAGAGDEVLFRMILPRAKTPDLVDALADLGHRDLLLPPAKAATSLDMDEDGTLTAGAILHLDDGRTLERRALVDQRYGRYYYLAGEGFFPVVEQEPDLALSRDPEGSARFPADRVAELYREHNQAFTAPENRVAPILQQLDFREMPDNLQVESFSADQDWCYLAGNYGLGSRRISLTELLSRRRANRKYLVGGAEWLKMTDTPLEWFHNLAEDRLWLDEDGATQGVRLTRREMLMLSALLPEVQIQAGIRGGDLLRQLLATDRSATAEQLPNLPSHLRDYQRHGVAWLNQLYRNRLAGILADDMGLGKTHQALALFDLIRSGANPDARFLVICPATVVPHWSEKIESFFPQLSHYVYHGSRRDLDKAGDCQVCLTTYGIIRRDSESLTDLSFEVIVYDEIQQLKNRKTDVHRAAARLKGQVVIGLTGTPLENSVHDLKAIFDICLPGYLGSERDFKSRYADPITEGHDQTSRQALTRLIAPFILRRTREQVLPELPEVIEDYRTCHLSDDQVSLYRELIGGHGQALISREGAGESGAELQYMELLAIINYLKQVCDHPCLIKKCQDVGRYRCGKWDLFVELLDECLDNNMKVVIFSHYTTMLDLIENYLRDRGIPHCGLRGEMPMAQRHRMIKNFNTDETYRVFTASLLTGGIGVDLTAARAVIHYDRWWNAAREDQATARVHRMGQKHVVQVFKLITVGTLEEKINRLIARKKDLANQLIREDDAAIIKRLSREELLDLLSAPGQE